MVPVSENNIDRSYQLPHFREQGYIQGQWVAYTLNEAIEIGRQAFPALDEMHLIVGDENVECALRQIQFDYSLEDPVTELLQLIEAGSSEGKKVVIVMNSTWKSAKICKRCGVTLAAVSSVSLPVVWIETLAPDHETCAREVRRALDFLL